MSRRKGRLSAEKSKRGKPGAAATAALRLTPEGRVASWSAGARRLLGEELESGRSLADLFPGAAEGIGGGLRSAAPAPFCVAPVGARQGRALALVCRPLGEGDWEGVLLPLEGGSGREAEILSALLHDLRTPLTTLLGAAELLGSGRLGAMPERAAGLLKVAAGAAAQITGLLEDAAARRAAGAGEEKR